MLRWVARRASWMVLAACAACAFDATVPAEVAIQCRDRADCPPGFDCVQNLHRCVAIVAGDDTPPALVNPVLSPPFATTRSQLELGFETSEPLGLIPVATLAGGGAFSLRSGDLDAPGRSWRFDYAVQGDEPPGAALVTVTLVDRSGNVAAGVAAGTVLLDYRRPELGAPALVAPTVATTGSTITAEIAFDEPIEGLPEVQAVPVAGGAAVAFEVEPVTGNQSFRGRWWVAAQVPEGSHDVTATARDRAGNANLFLPLATVVIDRTPPVVLDVTSSGTWFGPGSVAVVTVEASEELSGTPSLVARAATASAVPFETASVTGRFVTFLHPVAAGEDGAYQLELTGLADLAGNLGASGTVGHGLVFDGEVPTLRLTVAGATFSAVPGHNRVEVAVEGSEPIASERLHAFFGDQPMTCTAGAPPAPPFTCTHTVTGGSDGGVLLRVLATDPAGNVGYASAGVVLDFTAPSLLEDSVRTSITPPAGSLLARATRVTVDSALTIAFALDEPAAPGREPVVEMAAPSAIAFDRVAGSATSFLYELVLPPGPHVDGSYPIAIEAEDSVGNRQRLLVPLAIAAVDVDTTPPPPLGAEQLARLLYTRVPWGAEHSAGQPRFTLETTGPATAPVVEPRVTVTIWDRADRASGLRMGQTVADDDGQFARCALAAVDRPAVFVTQVDAAGNVDGAQASRVPNVLWVASLGGKHAGEVAANPHTLEQRPLAVEHLRVARGGSSGVVEADGATAGRLDGVRAVARGAREFVLRGPDHGLPPASACRDTGFFFHDPIRGGLWYYTPSSPGAISRFSGRTWQRRPIVDLEGDGEPTLLSAPGYAFDRRRGRLVAVGGTSVGSLLTMATWEWTGSSWQSWTAAADCAQTPTHRYTTNAAHDVGRGRTILLGNGWAGRDTWEHDGRCWDLRQPDDAALPPPIPDAYTQPRLTGVTAWAGQPDDGSAARVLLTFGTGSRFETWQWDGASWTRTTPAGPWLGYCAPAPEHPSACLLGYSLAYDPGRRRAAVFGGDPYAGWGDLTGDTFVFDGAAWAGLVPDDPEGDGNPSPGGAAGFTYDPSRRGLALLSSCLTARSELWLLGEGSWRLLHPGTVEVAWPAPRREPAIIYDSQRQRHVLFGGWAEYSTLFADLHEWDGRRWSSVVPGDPENDGNPAQRFAPAFAYDPVRGRAVLFGGCSSHTHDGWCSGSVLGDLWEWDGASWQRMAPTDPEGDGQPVARHGAAMAWQRTAAEPARGQLVLFGGCASSTSACPAPLGDTWAWDGVSWQRWTPTTSPAARVFASMVRDEARDRLLLFGGYTSAPDVTAEPETWALVGDEWHRLATTDPEGDGDPGVQRDSRLVYDGWRRQVALTTRAGLTNEVWYFASASWSHQAIADAADDGSPIALQHGTPFYDPASGSVLLFGGCSRNACPSAEMWELASGADARPAQVISLDLAAAAIPPLATLESMVLDVVTGGTGTDGAGSVVDGVGVRPWSAVGWGRAIPGGGSSAQPQQLTASLDTPLALAGAVVEDRIGFAIEPLGVNGSGAAEVSVDYFEAQLRYRLP